MAKLFTYAIITIGLVILFNAAGLQTVGSVVMEEFGISFETIQNFATSDLTRTFLVLALGGLAAVGIIIGILGRGSAEIAVTAFYALPLVSLMGDLISIVVFGGTGWVGYLLFLIMAPLIGGYVIALYDWVRGRD